jgi:hypothetical protein
LIVVVFFILQVRPIFNILNQGSRFFMGSGKFSIDELMIPYYGRHSTNQFIHGKPIRFGYKVWALCTSDGSGVYFEPYCGADTNNTDAGLGQGPNIVLDLCEKANLPPGSETYFDKFFTSFPLLDQLSEKHIAGTGTVHQNRLGNVPITWKKDLEMKDRGDQEVLFREDQVLVGWRDNRVVYMVSNKFTAENSTTCSRYSCQDRKNIKVSIPEMFKRFNSGIGGVDLLDAMVAVYRVRYRIRKWWFPIYAWSLSVCAVNAWRLRMQVTGLKEPFLDFLRELCVSMMAEHGSPPVRRNTYVADPAEEGRFDGQNHWMEGTEMDASGKSKRRNCRYCALQKKPDMKTVLSVRSARCHCTFTASRKGFFFL